jgi:hypothetical protein
MDDQGSLNHATAGNNLPRGSILKRARIKLAEDDALKDGAGLGVRF